MADLTGGGLEDQKSVAPEVSQREKAFAALDSLITRFELDSDDADIKALLEVIAEATPGGPIRSPSPSRSRRHMVALQEARALEEAAAPPPPQQPRPQPRPHQQLPDQVGRAAASSGAAVPAEAAPKPEDLERQVASKAEADVMPEIQAALRELFPNAGASAEEVAAEKAGLAFPLKGFMYLINRKRPLVKQELVRPYFDRIASAPDDTNAVAPFSRFIEVVFPREEQAVLRSGMLSECAEMQEREIAHNPALPVVEVPQAAIERWKEHEGSELEDVLSDGSVLLLDAKYIVQLAESKKILPPRQLLNQTAFVSLTEAQGASDNNDLLRIACISHCWLQPDHPDPHGYNLGKLGRALNLLLQGTGSYQGGRWGVFLDFSSIHQCCRDSNGALKPETFLWLDDQKCFADGAIGRYYSEDVLFKTALGSLGSFYSHPKTLVFMLTKFPDDYNEPLYRKSGNCATYFNRGWCYCEASWASLVKTSIAVLDLGLDSGKGMRFSGLGSLRFECKANRAAPVTPARFAESLESKGFTNGSTDLPLVSRLYGAAFEERFRSVRELNYAGLSWGDREAEAVAAVLASGHAPSLRKLDMSANQVGDAGARAVAAALPQVPALEDLDLSCNRNITDACWVVLSVAWAEVLLPRLLELEELGSEQLQMCRGDAFIRPLVDAFLAGRAPKLRKMDLSHRGLSDESAAVLARSLGALPSMQDLDLSGNKNITETGWDALSVAWLPKLEASLSAQLPELEVLGREQLQICKGDAFMRLLTGALLAGRAPRLRKMDLSDRGLGHESLAALAHCFGALPNLQELDLSRNRIADEGARALAAALPNAPALKNLSLGGNDIGQEGLAALGAAWQKAKGLPQLPSDLSELQALRSSQLGQLRGAGCVSARMLADAFLAGQAQRLRTLDLSDFNLGDKGVAALAASMASLPGLRKLRLQRNHICDEGASALATALTHAPELKELNLSSNSISDEGAHALVAALLKAPARMHLLINLDGNPSITEAVCAQVKVASQLAGLEVLGREQLKMYLGAREDGAPIGAFIRPLVGALLAGQAPRLRKMDLSERWLDHEGLAALAHCFGALPNLQELDLSRNGIADEGARALAAALPSAPALQQLSLATCSIGDEGVRALAAALPNAPALQHLDLRGGTMQISMQAHIVDELRAAWGHRDPLRLLLP